METGSIRKSDLEGKYVFWDIDGTLAPYRFNDHVSDPDGTNNGMSLKEISEHIFLTRMDISYDCTYSFLIHNNTSPFLILVEI